MRFASVMLTVLLIGLTADAFAGKRKRIPRLKKSQVAQKLCGEDALCTRMVKRHLIRDVRGCQIDPEFLNEAPELMLSNNIESKRSRGLNLYMGFFPGRYSYTVSRADNGGIKISSNVYFTNQKRWSDYESQYRVRVMQERLENAAKLWSDHNPYPFPLEFEFNLAEKRWGSDLKTRLVDKPSRGPYFWEWTLRWGYRTVAHEMGHVMGLDDEYKNGLPSGDTSRCDRGSMMCTSGPAHPYHYYMILRRALCKARI